jgi:hypothetical protein
MLSQDHGYTCTAMSVLTVSTTIYHQRLLSQHVQHDHYFLNIELV